MSSNVNNIQKNFKQEIPNINFYWNYEIAIQYVTSIVLFVCLFFKQTRDGFIFTYQNKRRLLRIYFRRNLKHHILLHTITVCEYEIGIYK